MEEKLHGEAVAATREAPAGRNALLASGLAALLASACCLGPLILVMVGISGAWIGSLAALEAYRPIFWGCPW